MERLFDFRGICTREVLGYEPMVLLEDGLREYPQWMTEDPVGGYRS